MTCNCREIISLNISYTTWNYKAGSVCREKGEELRAAVEEWQDKRNVPEPRLTTGFLDGIQPIVDSYELKVHPKPASLV